MQWIILHPNEDGDWINPRNPLFDTFIPIGDKKGDEAEVAFFIPIYSRGLSTARDVWCYNSSKEVLIKNINESIIYYNSQVDTFKAAKSQDSKLCVDDLLKYDSTKFSWGTNPKRDLEKFIKYSYDETSIRIGHYRPYFKQHVFFNRQLNDAVYYLPKLFPTPETNNLVICIDSVGAIKEPSLLITDILPDLHLTGTSQCFPLYYYEEKGNSGVRIQDAAQTPLFAAAEEETSYYQRKDGVSDFILNKAQTQYKDTEITKEDIFYYVYGILHSKEYRSTFSNDLKKMLARIPLVEKKEEFFAFSEAGRKLADLHLHYEEIPPYPDVEISGAEFENFRVTQMKFVKKGDKSRIIYNSSITLSNIPEKAYAYIVNGKSAIEWIMERYCVSVDKASGIKNDANDWADEVGNPRYILDLLLSVINVSVQTVDIVDSLPKLQFA
ncbi:type ISP restriction/modification enzyme [uncultured Methanocorpusculum sp.]|nr:type ISP restriction/modification enzyme [uncultured Methanocorpusculum sp.]